MIVLTEINGDYEQILENLRLIEENSEVKGMMLLICEKNQYDLDDLNERIKTLVKPIFGGIFPALISEGQPLNCGAILVGLHTSLSVATIQNINNPFKTAKDRISEIKQDMKSTNFIFCDSNSKNIDSYIDQLFIKFGLEHHYIGGCAGAMKFDRIPCVICNEGILEDSIVIASCDTLSGIGVGHGWRPVSEPIKVTESEGKHIKSLNWQPAYHFYQSWLMQNHNLSINEDNFFNLSKDYPFGVVKLDDDLVIRDLHRPYQDGILCFACIQDNSFIQIMNADLDDLVSGAISAKNSAEKAYITLGGNFASASIFIIDCISRALFMGEKINDELSVYMGARHNFGVFSLGEIGNNGKKFLELYNKTSVVAVLEG